MERERERARETERQRERLRNWLMQFFEADIYDFLFQDKWGFFCLIGKTLFSLLLNRSTAVSFNSWTSAGRCYYVLIKDKCFGTLHTSFHRVMESFHCFEWVSWSICLPIFFQRIKEYLLGSICEGKMQSLHLISAGYNLYFKYHNCSLSKSSFFNVVKYNSLACCWK